MAFNFKLPDIGEGVIEGEIIHWFVEEGDSVKEDQPLLEVMTDKATVEISSPVSGRVLQRIGQEGEVIEVGNTLVMLATDPVHQDEPSHTRAEGRGDVSQSLPEGNKIDQREPSILATPAVRRLAQKMGIDLRRVKGTGPQGRITRADLDNFQSDSQSVRSSGREAKVETLPYRALRRKIGDHLQLSKRTIPHYTYVEELDATQLIKIRRQLLGSAEYADTRLTYLPFFMKVLVESLKQYPLLNATLDEGRGMIELKKYYNCGVATATPQGLVVPVVKNVDQKSILQLAREVNTLTKVAMEGRVAIQDLRGSTFTITSLGALGGLLATPIVNYPEVAILGIHKIAERVVVRDGKIVVRDMMNLSLSLDHRVVDGVLAAQFLQSVISHLESLG